MRQDWTRHLPFITSFAMHGLVLALLIVSFATTGADGAQGGQVEVEMIQEQDVAAGAPVAAASATATADTDMPPPPAPAPGGVPTPPIPPPPKPRRPMKANVNIGNSEQTLEGLSVTGLNVVPPRPNGHRNLPPRSPAEASRRNEEGTVGLVIHVSAIGVPDWVELRTSSGSPSLDRAATEALLLWRFAPAMEGDKAVRFDYPMDIRFRLEDRR